MVGMALLTWISLLFLVVALVGSIAVAASRGLRAWRTFKRFSKTTSVAIEAVLETAAEAEQHAVAFTEGTQKLSAAAWMIASWARDSSRWASAALNFCVPSVNATA